MERTRCSRVTTTVDMLYRCTLPQIKLFLLKNFTPNSWLIRSLDESNLKFLPCFSWQKNMGLKTTQAKFPRKKNWAIYHQQFKSIQNMYHISGLAECFHSCYNNLLKSLLFREYFLATLSKWLGREMQVCFI